MQDEAYYVSYETDQGYLASALRFQPRFARPESRAWQSPSWHPAPTNSLFRGRIAAAKQGTSDLKGGIRSKDIGASKEIGARVFGARLRQL